MLKLCKDLITQEVVAAARCGSNKATAKWRRGSIKRKKEKKK